jgi:hypothetical protein
LGSGGRNHSGRHVLKMIPRWFFLLSMVALFKASVDVLVIYLVSKVISDPEMTNIAAYTPPGVAPPFISINDDGDAVEVIVRSAAAGPHSYGSEAIIRLPWAEFSRLVYAMAQHLVRHEDVKYMLVTPE